MASAHPNDPFVVFGYSYGGGASLEFVWLLNDKGGKTVLLDGSIVKVPQVRVDALILIDAVLASRSLMGRSFYKVPTFWADYTVPSSIGLVINIYANEEAYGKILPFDMGIEYIAGNNVLNIGLDFNHCTIGTAVCNLGRYCYNPIILRVCAEVPLPDNTSGPNLITYNWVLYLLDAAGIRR